MTIQELINEAVRRDPDLTIMAWDRVDYKAGVPPDREVAVEVRHKTYGQGSMERILLKMGPGTRADQVYEVVAGKTTTHWQVATLINVLADSWARVAAPDR